MPAFLLKLKLSLLLILFFALPGYAQNNHFKTGAVKLRFNTAPSSGFNIPVTVNPRLAERLKPPKNQLMSWRNYYLTAAEIEQRDRNNRLHQSIGRQIANDMVDSFVSSMLAGKSKKPVVAAPKF